MTQKTETKAAIAAARACVGTPFHHQGRTPGVGLDCIGLIVVALRAAGREVRDQLDYGRRPDGVSLIAALEAHGFKRVERETGKRLSTEETFLSSSTSDALASRRPPYAKASGGECASLPKPLGVGRSGTQGYESPTLDSLDPGSRVQFSFVSADASRQQEPKRKLPRDDKKGDLKETLNNKIKAGDVLVFRYDHQPQHVALATSRETMVHAFAVAGRVVETEITEYWTRRLVGVFRGQDSGFGIQDSGKCADGNLKNV